MENKVDTWFRQGRRQLLAGFALLALALAPLAAQAADLPKKVRIGVVTFPSADGKPEYTGAAAVVERDGWLAAELKKRGVGLEWFPVTSTSVAAQTNEAFSNHSIDFAGYGDLPGIMANANGLDTRLLMSWGSGSNTYLVVPAKSTAKSIKDLVGKRIALHRGRPWEYPFARLLAANGLKFSDFKILNLNPQAGAAAVATGSADAFFTLSDAYTLEDQGVGKIIWASKTPPQDWKMRGGLWADKEFVNKYPEIAQLVVTAHVRATQWTSQEANRDAYLKLIARNGQPESVVRRDYDGEAQPWKNLWAPQLDDNSVAHYQALARYAKESGLVRKELDAKTLLDPRFLKVALRDLKLESYWSTGAIAP